VLAHFFSSDLVPPEGGTGPAMPLVLALALALTDPPIDPQLP
jgi:hypothetical protein